jgi:Fe(3+) dicitrate transport protein
MLSRLSANQTLGLRFNHFAEGSVVTYSGLREAEWLVNPRGNPFRNDRFDTNRYAASVQHTWAATPQLLLNSSGYSSIFLRDWWRQSSSSAQRPNDAADPLCGGMANLLTTCGNEGRLRAYYTWGLEQRARWSPAFGGRRHEIDFGIRYHDELQERVQKNGPLPLSRDGVLVENNRRVARAFSGFLQDRLTFGRLTATLGARVERIHYNRTNRLGLGGAGVFGETSLLEVIPGVGLSYSFSEKLTIFSGVHRGFAPPRVEDLISNTTGLAVDLNAERSWSYESGVRSRLGKETMLEATWFHSDFSNQIVPSSVAGGLGAVLTNGGRTIHSGLEFSGRWMRRALGGSKHGAGLSGSYTMLPTAEFAGQRRSSVAGFTNVSVTGNRLPYAPRSLANATVHYAHQNGVNAQLEAVYTGRQFGDDLNTVGGTPDGQRGRIPSALVWNATVNVPVESWGTTFFVTAKNLTDRLYIADRTRGLLPGMPRLIQAGFRFAF